MAAGARRLATLLAIPTLLALIAGPVAQAVPASPAPSTSVRAAEAGPVAVPAKYLKQKISWSPCDFDAAVKDNVASAPTTRCTTVKVPMDWKNPTRHRDISLSIAYSRATGKSKGLLTSNPGGPGVEGLQLTAALAISKTAMFRDYDLLGFDPRGFGTSENVRCLATQASIDKLPQVVDHRARNPQTHRAEVATARFLAKACSSTEFSRYVSTQQTVYDLDFLRALLGHSTVNYIGYSYGTWLGSWYADTYPKRVGRFILDSNMEWTASMYANSAADSFAFQRRRDQMLFPWIARNNDVFELGSTAAAVSKRYESIRRTLVHRTKNGEPVTDAQILDWVVLTSIYRDNDFIEAGFVIALVGLEADSPATFSSADSRRLKKLVAKRLNGAGWQIQRAASGSVTSRPKAQAQAAEEKVEIPAAGDIIRCNDTAYSTNINGYLRRADADGKRYSFIGYQNSVPQCAYWPFRQNGRTLDLTGAPRMLMFQSEGDPATSFEGSAAAHAATKSRTRFVSVDNEGQHGLYVDGPSSCVEKYGDTFLFSGRLPATDIVCSKGTTPLPGDAKVFKLDGPVDGKSYPLRDKSRSFTTAAKSQNAELSRIRREAANRSLG